jgi:TRAP-type C4-dicarboxylate transport system substrate-binding protein
MSRTIGRVGLTIALGLCLAGASCTGGIDKAGGGKPQRRVVLSVLNTRTADDVQPYADKVADLSKGVLRLEVGNKFERTSTSAEADAIRAIQAGRADLAVVPARAWHSVGVRSFDALLAPLAIDSMALQHKVLATGMPEKMLSGVEQLGLGGIGILPGVMRKPAGITRPLLEPSDYRGAVIGFSPSVVAAHALRALGATPVASPFEGADISAFDGVEQQVGTITNLYDGVVRTITENVDLWPRPLVIVASRRAMHTLSAQQVSWLRSAAHDSLDASTQAQLRVDSDEVGAMCRRGKARFITASPAQLALLKAAFAPVYTWLRGDEQTAGFLDQIAALRASGITPYPQELQGCPGDAGTTSAPGGSTALDGTYRMVTTAHTPGSDPNVAPENWGTWIFVFERGRFAFTQENAAACTWGYGTYTVSGQRVAWTFVDGGGIAPTGAFNRLGEYFVFGWSTYRGVVTLSAVAGEISPDNFFVKPWHLLSRTPAASALSKRCPPPAAALH